jgi:hypothetical protein
MSYIQIALGGEQRGLKFNQLAIEIIASYNDNATSTGFLYAMIYGGLRGSTYVKREEATYTFEDVCDWVDSMPDKDETVKKITEALTETQIWKDLVKQGTDIIEAKEEKKKA